jgi:hypothetical protein
MGLENINLGFIPSMNQLERVNNMETFIFLANKYGQTEFLEKQEISIKFCNEKSFFPKIKINNAFS